ncbi:MAG TPA: sigma-70 family RNA polymerase sigma factor [Planctomycetaceae bacterium]|nr:sigma-70 family RNA polymerase sigma factor [Planctomycetaceae bacterium]
MAEERTGLDIEALVAEHHRAVYGYAFRLTGSVADAEDLTQQVFLTAYRNLAQLREPASARRWLFAILRNTFLKNHAKRRPVPVSDLDLNIEAIGEDVPEERPIDQEQLQAAVDELPEKFRIVLVMFYYEGCPYREIAEELRLPIGTVMSRLARAKRYLRAHLFGSQAAVPFGRTQTTDPGE